MNTMMTSAPDRHGLEKNPSTRGHMKTSLRGRLLCREEICDVEINPSEKYCEAHQYMIDHWLKKSRAALAQYRVMSLSDEISDSKIIENSGDLL